MTLELKVKMNILWTIPWLHFPPSLPILLLRLLLHQSPPRLSFFILVWQWNKDLDVVEREESRLPVQHPLVPVLVDLIGQGDNVALVEAQLALVLWIEVI